MNFGFGLWLLAVKFSVIISQLATSSYLGKSCSYTTFVDYARK